MTVMLLQHSPLQHYKPPSSTTTTAAPPTTAEKDKSPTTTTRPAPPPPLKVRPQINLLTSHHIVSPSKHRMSCNAKAMRYYRLWIYTCNAVLLLSVLGFAIVAGRIVVADPRRYLVPGLSLYQPSFLYAYLALATQSGLLQLVGCLGALRLNERLLNVYWLLLLVLLFGDAIVGIVWVFRFDKICSDLRPTLKQRLAAEYGVDADFTTLWDALQRDYQCCGVDGAQDFSGVVVTVNRTGVVGSTATSSNSDWLWPMDSVRSNQGVVPESCCVTEDSGESVRKRPMMQHQKQQRQNVLKGFQNLRTTTSTSSSSTTTSPSTSTTIATSSLPPPSTSASYVSSSSTTSPSSTTTTTTSTTATSTTRSSSTNSTTAPAENGSLSHVVSSESNLNRVHTDTNKVSSSPTMSSSTVLIQEPCSSFQDDQIHAAGCKDSLLLWLRQSADVLFVLGYCVIAFLKLCFVGILRYEIKEMIQKIKILQGELRPPQLSLTELGGANSPTLHSPGGGASNTPHLQPLLMNHHENSNGGLVSVQVGTTGGSHQSPPPGTGGNALLLLQPPDSLQTTPLHVSTAAQRHLNLLNDGTDSDTNSNCALIISEDSGKPTRTKQPRGSNGNNNYEIHELQELNRLLSRHQTQI